MKITKYFLLFIFLYATYIKLMEINNKKIVNDVDIESEEDELLQKNLYKDFDGEIKKYLDF
ncbi:TPA: hypothetical protein KE807_002646 [Staphylococcus aureus]|nr:hypothetical protein [Staphylococcus epidermidis]HBC9226994.1 hypothetical protein [Staphylococcus aureus]HCU7682416.1 hypothetical protein [Staphylococcus aureus]